jgi:GAF domain-containing protein
MQLTEYEESLRSTVRLARIVCAGAAASIFLRDPESGALVFEVSSGVGQDEIVGMEVPAGQGIVGWVADAGEPLVLRDVQSDQRFARDRAEETGYVPRTMMATPVFCRGEVAGVMEVLDPGSLDGPDGPRDLEALDVLTEIAGQVGLLLQHFELRRSTGPVSDELTNEFRDLVNSIPDDRVSDLRHLVSGLRAVLS